MHHNRDIRCPPGNSDFSFKQALMHCYRDEIRVLHQFFKYYIMPKKDSFYECTILKKLGVDILERKRYIEECAKKREEFFDQIFQERTNELDKELSECLTADTSTKKKPGRNKPNPEVQEFGKWAIKVIITLIEIDVDPKIDLVTNIISEMMMDISVLSQATIRTYYYYAKKIVKDKLYISQVLSGEMSAAEAYRKKIS